jgi:hypothetical protein
MMDALDGLAALEQVVETIGEQLDDLYQRRDIPQIERVTLRSLEWTLANLADDLHTIDTEVKDLRLSVAALRELDLQRLGDMSRIAKERDELRAQLEEVRAQAARNLWMEWQPPANVDKLYKRIPGDAIMVHKLLVGDDLPALYEAGWRYLPITPENELTKKAGDLGVQQLSPRQVEISDSTGTDGEGQPK